MDFKWGKRRKSKSKLAIRQAVASHKKKEKVVACQFFFSKGGL